MAIKKSYRVKRQKDFDQIFAAKDSFANRKFVVYKLKTGVPHYRVGLSVSKKLGNAVTRNRVKRLMRHALRSMEANIEAVDFVLIARPGVEALDFQAVQSNLKHLLKLSKIYHNGEKD
ncbi:ribonuclease P protein component [Lactococcus termiticola]|uniref:Ribonuclease P protein component n=1 Tax=Lactococcus termiticola TaxID=2169526 RepID=A0A2R5HFH7_9LACT|nr:ribonuclease P protein component [Lactococcus termiticola]GBG96823.1 ribonuclease P [Lactococcus termiticola]